MKEKTELSKFARDPFNPPPASIRKSNGVKFAQLNGNHGTMLKALVLKSLLFQSLAK